VTYPMMGLICCFSLVVGAAFPDPHRRKTFGERIASAMLMLIAAFFGTTVIPGMFQKHPILAGFIGTTVCMGIIFLVRIAVRDREEEPEEEPWNETV
jgi:hypothetical protein